MNPRNELETEEDDDDEDVEEDDDGFEILDPIPGKKVTSSSKGKEAEPSPMEAAPTVIAPMVTASTTCEIAEETVVGGATTASENAVMDLQVQGQATTSDAHDVWLIAIVWAPLQSSAAAASLESTAVPETESARVDVANTAEVPVEEAVELVVVQAADSVFEVVPRNCEDAIQ